MSKKYDKIEEVEKNIDHIEEVQKFNPFHDSKGRFSNKHGFASYSANPNTRAGAMAIARSAATGHGKTVNVHPKSFGEDIDQNVKWMGNGKLTGNGGRVRNAATHLQFKEKYRGLGTAANTGADWQNSNRIAGYTTRPPKSGTTPNGGQPATPKANPQPKTQAKPQPNPQKQPPGQSSTGTAAGAQQAATKPPSGTVRVKQRMKSGQTMDADFDQSTVKGAKNKEFRGTAEGRDLTKEFKRAAATDSYSGESRYTNQVLDLQGFNSPMKRVSQAEFNKLVQAHGDVFMREVGSAHINGKGVTAKGMKRAYSTENDMKLNGTGGRAYGDGLYTASAAQKAYNNKSYYNGITDPKLHSDVRAEVKGYGDGKTVMKMAWLKKPKIALQNQIEQEFNSLPLAERRRFGNHVNTYAAAKGYDAIRTSRSWQDCYMVVLNRSKVAILDD